MHITCYVLSFLCIKERTEICMRSGSNVRQWICGGLCFIPPTPTQTRARARKHAHTQARTRTHTHTCTCLCNFYTTSEKPHDQENLHWIYKVAVSISKVKVSKAIPVTGLRGLYGCEMLRIPHCLDNRLIDGSKAVSPTHPPHFTPQKHYYFSASRTHFC
jgi:hypothetical protein